MKLRVKIFIDTVYNWYGIYIIAYISYWTINRQLHSKWQIVNMSVCMGAQAASCIYVEGCNTDTTQSERDRACNIIRVSASPHISA